jgi:hypothetical protein
MFDAELRRDGAHLLVTFRPALGVAVTSVMKNPLAFARVLYAVRYACADYLAMGPWPGALLVPRDHCPQGCFADLSRLVDTVRLVHRAFPDLPIRVRTLDQRSGPTGGAGRDPATRLSFHYDEKVKLAVRHTADLMRDAQRSSPMGGVADAVTVRVDPEADADADDE